MLAGNCEVIQSDRSLSKMRPASRISERSLSRQSAIAVEIKSYTSQIFPGDSATILEDTIATIELVLAIVFYRRSLFSKLDLSDRFPYAIALSQKCDHEVPGFA